MSLIFQGAFGFIKSAEICKVKEKEIEIGRGGFGIVYKAILVIKQKYLPDKTVDIALKRVYLPKAQDKRARMIELIKREQSVYKSVKSPHIIKLYGTNQAVQKKKFEELDFIEFYLEYCDGNLADLIIDKEKWVDVPFFEEQALEIFDQILEVEFLLQKSTFQRSNFLFEGLYHRDINLKNILYKKRKNKIIVKVCDFGISQYMESTVTNHTGTNNFMSPENQSYLDYDLEKNETWSLGILLFCLLKGIQCYKNNIKLFYDKENSHHILINNMKINLYTKDLLINLLQYNPSMRWGYTQIKQSQWYKLFGSKKVKKLEKIAPILKLRQKYFNDLSLLLIQYEMKIKEAQLKEFLIPKELLLKTIQSYELWSQRQLEKYSGTYTFDFDDEDDEILKQTRIDQQKQEHQLVTISRELHDFFIYIKYQDQRQKIKQDENLKQIIEYWSQILGNQINNQQNNQINNSDSLIISNFKPDTLFYYFNYLQEMKQKLINLLSISQNNNRKKLNDSIQKLTSQYNFFKEKNQEQKQDQQQILFTGQFSVKSSEEKKKEINNQNKQEQVCKNQNQSKLKVEDFKQLLEECQTRIDQKQYLLKLLDDRELKKNVLELLGKLQQSFYLFFEWKQEKLFKSFLESTI